MDNRTCSLIVNMSVHVRRRIAFGEDASTDETIQCTFREIENARYIWDMMDLTFGEDVEVSFIDGIES